MRAPIGTYRLQLTPEFDFAAALEALPYLQELGVSHVYLSPCLQAVAGSSHGYDVTDPGRIDAERGGEPAFVRLLEAARGLDLSVLLDIVPNHMAASEQGPWWRDVLAAGRDSRFAGHFDIDWDCGLEELRGKVLLPILGDDLDAEIERGHVRVVDDSGAGEPCLGVYDRRLPLCAADAADLHELLGKQHYRLEYWRSGLRRLNWRRFFDVATLVGVRVEDPAVFEATHAKVLEFVQRGLVQGLRIDHPDGLRDPVGYFRRLRAAAPDAWILVEKILEGDEGLPSDWPVDGTTGYEFMNRATGLFVDPDAESAMTSICEQVVGECPRFEDLQAQKRSEVLQLLFVPELERLAALLVRIAGAQGLQSDVDAARSVLHELLVTFPVYRTYVSESGQASPADLEHLEVAARGVDRSASPALLKILLDVLRGGGDSDDEHGELRARFQQLSGPVIAKGVEDTALYCDRRLLALAEVGGDPGRFGTSPHEFHEFCARQARDWPRSLLATSTHDTKRSGDMRLRIAALTEFATEWAEEVEGWIRDSEPYRSGEMPDRGSQYLLYQTLVGVWPASVERIEAKMLKAVREAKEHTSWIDGDREFEQALQRFVAGILADEQFVARVDRFVSRVLPVARTHVLAQHLLKIAAPGVPDFYQGCEHWREVMVDPDNRRPVDFDGLRGMLNAVRGQPPEAVLDEQDGGLAKVWLTRRALAARRANEAAFAPGSGYEPLSVRGPGAGRVVAFRRVSAGGARQVVVAVPRLVRGAPDGWAATELDLPEGGHDWDDVLQSSAGALSSGAPLPLARLWARFPVALLVQRRT